ncbi:MULTISPECIES: flagellar basal body L-ring protein FlgH [unclassified Duganella]|uniref:flagellar basal body L-ring protein FlgH n=1 Tax=unclassified Duganella TaxID=2636909 RepID=UPI0006F3C60E|nr:MULTISPECIES: flagellar basal body L-ring protein FlgH [unclassified Duganella]KQV61719.1 flagellar basal body L-ring protein [Duganella sp. Root336D2]KRB84226.1 flagellar basal body L-ring protein [Duganella sp. Root198D2]
MKSALPALALLLLAGCSSLEPTVRPAPHDEAPALTRSAPPRGSSGGVFNPDSSISLVSDSRAFRVGDIVTVILQETTQASKSAGTTLAKDSSVGIAAPGLLGKTFPKAGVDISAERGFKGDAQSTQQNALSGAITVIVQEVMPNGLLKVAGEKVLTLNQGEEFVRLRGFLRAADIDANNMVSSQRIANARIAYGAQGTLADTNRPGWLTRFFLGPLMPF